MVDYLRCVLTPFSEECAVPMRFMSILESVLSEEHNLIPSFNLSQIRVKKAKGKGRGKKR